MSEEQIKSALISYHGNCSLRGNKGNGNYPCWHKNLDKLRKFDVNPAKVSRNYDIDRGALLNYNKEIKRRICQLFCKNVS